MSVSQMRTAYRQGRLDPGSLGADPFAALTSWIEQAADAGTVEPNAMALATVGEDGRPSLRMVLCKGVDARGLTFYTHLESRKGQELQRRPVAAATFWWERLERQVRVEGPVERVPVDEADAYFASRPRGSQLGAWASPQSRSVDDRADLERAAAEAEARFPEGTPVPRPPGWVGLRVAPTRIEFWQGRENRLHDRIVFTRVEDGWKTERLAP